MNNGQNQEVSVSDKPFELEVKRAYIPVEIKADCPKCGKTQTREYGQRSGWYFSYPTFNKPITESFDCNTPECGETFAVKIVLGITARVT